MPIDSDIDGKIIEKEVSDFVITCLASLNKAIDEVI